MQTRTRRTRSTAAQSSPPPPVLPPPTDSAATETVANSAPAAPASKRKLTSSRSSSTIGGAKTPKAKRARVTVEPGESDQVTALPDSYRLPLADADAYYVPDLVDPATAQKWHDQLLELDEWYRPTLKVYGRSVTQSRRIAAFATDRDLSVKYSGTTVEMSYDYPPLLREIQDLVEARLGVKFNHVMLNHYENGQIHIGNHRDNRENRVIASLSLGAPRTFILTHDKPPAQPPSASTAPKEPEPDPSPNPGTDADPDANNAAAPPPPPPSPPLLYSHRSILASGSLIVMQGTMQQFWKHQVPKEKKVEGSRISLTFRQLVF